MSVDLTASLNTSIPLSDLLAKANEVIAKLTGITTVPKPKIMLGNRYHMGQVIEPGHIASPENLDAVVIGPGTEKRNLGIIDFISEEGEGLVAIFESPDTDWRVIFSPYRHATGTVWSIGLALAAALLGNGEFMAYDLRLLDPPINDPQAFIARTSQPPNSLSFDEACLAYLHTFPLLKGWPSA